MDKINIVDHTFAHSILGYCSDFQVSDQFTWDRGSITTIDTPIVYTDMVLGMANTTYTNKYAWLIEPIEVAPQNYSFIKTHNSHFVKVFTHEKELLDLGAPYEFVPFGCCWIKPEDQLLHSKNKMVSIIASNKTQTVGHRLRHDAINNLKDSMDVYGRGWSEIPYKLDGLKDYRFSVVIENCKRDYWFTEKLIDCLATGTVPIYWGCPSIGDFFDTKGFIMFNTVDELKNILDNLTEDKYNEMFEAVTKNLETAKKYLLPDDYIYQKLK